METEPARRIAYGMIRASAKAEATAAELRRDLADFLAALGAPVAFKLEPHAEGFRVHGDTPAETEALAEALMHLGYAIRWRSPSCFIALPCAPTPFVAVTEANRDFLRATGRPV
jgi:hypothetical protein